MNLFAALEVATEAILTGVIQKRYAEFREFIDKVLSDLPEGKGIHVILHTYWNHKKNEVWLIAHPAAFFNFMPTSRLAQ